MIVLIVGISNVSASEYNFNLTGDSQDYVNKYLEFDDSQIGNSESEISYMDSEIEDNDLELVNGDNQISENEQDIGNDSCIIYIGQNKTSDGGNGSYGNPFATLNLAAANTSGENKVTVNIFNGSYYLDSVLTFNTNNLILQGISGEVVIKSPGTETNNKIQLYSSSANFTMKNIIFDASDFPNVNQYWGPVFFPFSGNANYGTFNNCSFTGFKYSRITGSKEYNAKFINCLFEGFCGNGQLFNEDLQGNKFVLFKNCIFLNKDINSLAMTYYTDKNITLDGMWFGQNSVPEYIHGGYQVADGSTTTGWLIPITKYAIFTVFENYLGNNQYEIIGKLVWNDSTTEGIEDFNPMTVKLSSSTGEIQSTVKLVNGSFKVNYKSDSLTHSVSAQLDNEKIDLNFNTISMQLNEPSIYYGDDQNITINFNQNVEGTINITVNNKTYKTQINGNSLTYNIGDKLTKGNYSVLVSLNDVNHVHAIGYTNIEVSKVTDYMFDLIAPSDVKVGFNNTFIIELPEDVSGNISIKVDGNIYTVSAGPVCEINIDNFGIGDNEIAVTYSGDNKYVSQNKSSIVTAAKTELVFDNSSLINEIPSDSINPLIRVNLASDATGKLTVTVNGKNYTSELVNGSANVVIFDLAPGNYKATITYSGDDKYESITVNTTVNVAKIVLNAKNFVMLYDSGSKYTVHVTADGKAVIGKTVNFVVNGKKVTAKTDKNGYASVKINLPPKSKEYSVSAEYLGVKISNKVTVKSIVVAKNLKVKKSAKTLKIKVTLKKVNGKYLKGKKVTLKFKGKIYKAKTSKKGIATFKIKKNVLKKLKSGKKYTYKVIYLKDTVSKNISVKK